jgi:hypothetical protein
MSDNLILVALARSQEFLSALQDVVIIDYLPLIDFRALIRAVANPVRTGLQTNLLV